MHPVLPATYRVAVTDNEGREHVALVKAPPATNFRPAAFAKAFGEAARRGRAKLSREGVKVAAIASVTCTD